MQKGIEQQLEAVLEEMLGSYPRSLVCSEDGFPIATFGDAAVNVNDLAAFTSLFDTVLERAVRDLALTGVDEVTLLDAARHRLVIRPLPLSGDTRMFLVIWADKHATWRRNTGIACQRLAALLAPLTADVA